MLLSELRPLFAVRPAVVCHPLVALFGERHVFSADVLQRLLGRHVHMPLLSIHPGRRAASVLNNLPQNVAGHRLLGKDADGVT